MAWGMPTRRAAPYPRRYPQSTGAPRSGPALEPDAIWNGGSRRFIVSRMDAASFERFAAFIRADNARRDNRARELEALVQQVPVPDEVLKEVAWAGPLAARLI